MFHTSDSFDLFHTSDSFDFDIFFSLQYFFIIFDKSKAQSEAKNNFIQFSFFSVRIDDIANYNLKKKFETNHTFWTKKQHFFQIG